MSNLQNYAGSYSKIGASKWRGQQDAHLVEFIVGSRKEATMKKPKEYLLYSIDKGRPQYFSSIYTNEAGVKWVEYGGIIYNLQDTPSKVTLEQVQDADQ